VDPCYHDQTASMQTAFDKDVHSLVTVIEDLGNHFEEESMDLIVLDTKEIAGPAAVEAVRKVKMIGQEQFKTFTREHLLERTQPIDDVIRHNELKVFGSPGPKTASKGKHQLPFLKNYIGLLSRLYIGYQMRARNL